MQRDRDDLIKCAEGDIGKIEVGQQAGQSRADGKIVSIFELVNRIVDHALINQCRAGKSIMRFIFQALSANVISGRRIGKDGAANRAEALRDVSDVLAAFPAEDFVLNGFQYTRTGDAKRRKKRV